MKHTFKKAVQLAEQKSKISKESKSKALEGLSIWYVYLFPHGFEEVSYSYLKRYGIDPDLAFYSTEKGILKKGKNKWYYWFDFFMMEEQLGFIMNPKKYLIL